jgi:prophage maintenance system killer protein
MANNHGFIDGNKRTTLLLANLLIDKSGYTLRPRAREDLVKAMADMIVGVASGELTIEQIVEWFEGRLRRKSSRAAPMRNSPAL